MFLAMKFFFEFFLICPRKLYFSLLITAIFAVIVIFQDVF